MIRAHMTATWRSISRLGVAALLVTTSGGARAAAQGTQYQPHPWKNCANTPCNPSEALQYLLWSRESDINACHALYNATVGSEESRRICGTLIKGKNSGAPIDEYNVVDGFIRFVNSQTSTFPIGSSSSGFARSGNAGELLNSASFGPFFVERPLTGGQHSFSLKASVQRTVWRALDGVPFNNIVTEEGRNPQPTDRAGCLTDNERCPSLRWAAKLSFVTYMLVVGGTYGITSRLDVGVDVPFERAEISGVSARSGGFNPGSPNGTVQASDAAHGVAYGFGDVSVHAKYKIPGASDFGGAGMAWGVNGELKLPTGRPELLIGTGRTQARGSLLGAYTMNPVSGKLLERLSTHGALGYTRAGSGIHVANAGHKNTNQYTGDFSIDLSDELNWALGIDVPLKVPYVLAPDATGRVVDSTRPGPLTLGVDFVGRTLRDGAEFRNVDFIGTTERFETQPFLFPRPRVHLLLASAGVKACVASRYLLTANVLFPLTARGVRPGVTPVFAIERASFDGTGCSGFRRSRAPKP